MNGFGFKFCIWEHLSISWVRFYLFRNKRSECLLPQDQNIKLRFSQNRLELFDRLMMKWCSLRKPIGCHLPQMALSKLSGGKYKYKRNCYKRPNFSKSQLLISLKFWCNVEIKHCAKWQVKKKSSHMKGKCSLNNLIDNSISIYLISFLVQFIAHSLLKYNL